LRNGGARGRFLWEESGFTLAEMMVTIVIWIVVLFALYSLFDMSLRAFSVGNNKTEAVENARLGLEKMEREIRQAYAYDRANDNTLLLETWEPARIRFGNDLNGDRVITCPDAANCEYITYKLTDDADGSNAACTVSPCDLRRVNTSDSTEAGEPVVEDVEFNGLSFTYYRSDGTAPANESEIGKVLVSLEVEVSPGTRYAATQTLITEIDLRNR